MKMIGSLFLFQAYLKKQIQPLFEYFKTITADWTRVPTGHTDQYVGWCFYQKMYFKAKTYRLVTISFIAIVGLLPFHMLHTCWIFSCNFAICLQSSQTSPFSGIIRSMLLEWPAVWVWRGAGSWFKAGTDSGWKIHIPAREYTAVKAPSFRF